MDRPALVSLTFDDGLRCQFERAVPILEEHRFRATFFLVANTDPIHTDGYQHPDWRKIDWSEKDIRFLRNMIQRGYEVGAHSVTHRYPQLDNDPNGEAEKSKLWIEDRLGVEVASYCYPFCHITPPITEAVIKAGYKQARGGANGSYYSSQSQIDYLNVDCREIRSSENVDDWIHPGCWHVLLFHGIGNSGDGYAPIPIEEFRRQMAELAKRRDSDAVEVATFRDAANRSRAVK